MNIDNLDNVLFSIDTNKDLNLEVKYKFVYNNYVENETTVNDKSIYNRSNEFLKNRFIRIEIENLPENISIINNEDLNDLENSLSYFDNIIIDKNDREFFNKIDNINPSMMSLVLDNKYEDLNNFFKLYSVDQENLSNTDFSLYNKSSIISLLKNENYINKFKNKEYAELFNFNNLSVYDNYEETESIKKLNDSINDDYVVSYRSGKLFPNMRKFSSILNPGTFQDYSSKNALFCGVYIEKFIKDEVNGNYKFLCGKFTRLKNNQDNTISSLIEDEAVRYGKTYRYAVHSVYIYSAIDSNNRYILDRYLLCSHPYLSNDLHCLEYNNPPEPVNLSISYDYKLKNLMLTWEEPTNYEGDVKGYQILKRHDINSPFQLVKQLEGHLKSDLYNDKEINIDQNSIIRTPGKINNYFIDREFDNNKMTIYTIRSIDAHGMKSNYGSQIGVFFDIAKKELITALIARSGANILYPNETILNKSKFHENNVDIVDNLPYVKNPKKINLYLTPDFRYIKDGTTKHSTLGSEYQFTFSNIDNYSSRKHNFSIINFEE